MYWTRGDTICPDYLSFVCISSTCEICFYLHNYYEICRWSNIGWKISTCINIHVNINIAIYNLELISNHLDINNVNPLWTPWYRQRYSFSAARKNRSQKDALLIEREELNITHHPTPSHSTRKYTCLVFVVCHHTSTSETTEWLECELVIARHNVNFRNLSIIYICNFTFSQWKIRLLHLLHPIRFLPQWSWVLSNLCYEHSSIIYRYDKKKKQNKLVHISHGLDICTLWNHFERHEFDLETVIHVDRTKFKLRKVFSMCWCNFLMLWPKWFDHTYTRHNSN